MSTPPLFRKTINAPRHKKQDLHPNANPVFRAIAV